MAYLGHVYGDSAPYQIKIPDATTTQDGVMTKEQVSLLGEGATIRLCCTAEDFQPVSAVQLGVFNTFPNAGVVASFLVDEARTISRYRLAIGSGVADDTDLQWRIRYSVNDGVLYTSVLIATLTAGQLAKAGEFAPIQLPAGAFVQGAVTRVAGGGNVTASYMLNLR
jgi:hypothetical protein